MGRLSSAGQLSCVRFCHDFNILHRSNAWTIMNYFWNERDGKASNIDSFIVLFSLSVMGNIQDG